MSATGSTKLTIVLGEYELIVEEKGNSLSDEAFAKTLRDLLHQGPMDWYITLRRRNTQVIE